MENNVKRDSQEELVAPWNDKDANKTNEDYDWKVEDDSNQAGSFKSRRSA